MLMFYLDIIGPTEKTKKKPKSKKVALLGFSIAEFAALTHNDHALSGS